MKHTEHELDYLAERKAFLAILRDYPEHRHIRHAFWADQDQFYCAVGLGVVKLKGRRTSEAGLYLMRRLGLPKTAIAEIYRWNDVERLTFAQIADKIEEANWEVVDHDAAK